MHPQRELFPPDEHSSYTAAAVLLAVDGITQTTQASDLFAPATTDRSRPVATRNYACST